MEAGTIYRNCQLANDYSVPFGGYTQSGWDYEYGWKGIEGYLIPTVMENDRWYKSLIFARGRPAIPARHTNLHKE